MPSTLQTYLERAGSSADAGAVAYVANLTQVASVAPEVAQIFVQNSLQGM